MNNLQHPCNISIEKKKRYLQWKKLFRLLEYSSNKEKEEPILVLIGYHCDPPSGTFIFESAGLWYETLILYNLVVHISQKKKKHLCNHSHLHYFETTCLFLLNILFQLEMHHITDLQRVANAKSGRYDIFNII